MNDARLLALKIQKLKLLEQKQQIIREQKLWLFKPYDWQRKLWAAGKYNRQRLLMAANQVGKTSGICVEYGYQLTGIYPDDWEGHVFRFPINAWALGVSAEQIKKVLQSKLIGEEMPNENGDMRFQGGLIPTSYIDHDSLVRGQYKGSIKEIKIKHKAGGWSKLSFLSYEQSQRVFMGSVVDFILVDEEPIDPAIYGQLLVRTLNGDQKRGGLMMLGFTPEYGETQLVYQFTEDLQRGQFFSSATWDDAPHLSEDKKTQILNALPVHERLMRSQGVPMRGEGAIYPISDDRIYDECEELPPHWARLNGIDFGYRFCGLIWMAYDRDNDTIHIYDVMKCEDLLPSELSIIMRGRGEWIPWAWPQDGHLPDRNTGVEQKELYKNEKVKMLSKHSQDKNGGVSREAGILRINQRMRAGKFKVARHLKSFFDEKRLYYRKAGKIVKKNDHILDAVRYAEMMLRFATTDAETNGYLVEPSYLTPRYR